ncbi:MAG: porin family protein [Candidatus Omnitrophica bacterium]|nr:porin family protein [Candidatus Omnitrophota bacterium]
MKKILSCLFVAGLIIGIAQFASAAVQQGDTTLTLNVGYSYMDIAEGETSSWDITGRIALGKFLTNNFQLEGILNGTVGEMYESLDYHYGAIVIRPNFHFATEGATVPYIGAAAGFFFYDIEGESDTNFIWGGQVGLKQFIRDNVFLQMEASYLMTEMIDEELNLFRILVGLGFKL